MVGQGLMINHGGALGDTGYLVPALNVLREEFQNIHMCTKRSGQLALGDTDLIDGYIIKPRGFNKWDVEYGRRWLLTMSEGTESYHVANTRGAIASKFMFHTDDPLFEKPVEWKREKNEGVSYFDETSLHLQIKSGGEVRRDGVPEAVGKRPITKLSHKERSWLRDFRHAHNIPKDAFLLGWQFTGSSFVKWYPHFDKVIQYGIMTKYPHVYVVGLGDMENKLRWNKSQHKGRFINLADSVSFRQAYILTSIFDLLVSPETGVFVFSQAFPDVPKILLASHTSGKHICCGDETVILQPRCECSPCYNIVATCTVHAETGAAWCMASIEPERVIEAIEAEIRRRCD